MPWLRWEPLVKGPKLGDIRDFDLKLEHFLNLTTIPIIKIIVVTIRNPMINPTVIAATWPDSFILPSMVLSKQRNNN